MKNVTHLFTIILVFLTFFSCVENGITIPNDYQTSNTFQVTIDGELFTTNQVDYVTDGNIVFLNAVKTDTDEIFTIRVSDFGLGTFNFDGTDNTASYIKNNSTSADIWSTFDSPSSQGEITFTSIDDVNNTISGEFNFSGKHLVNGEIKSFTSGSFSNIPKSVTPPSDDTFTAKVDGVEFNEITLFANLLTVGNTSFIQINANKSLTETISLSFESDISVGEHNLGSFTKPTGQYTVNSSSFFADGNGKMNITTHDTVNKQISGTFEFEASPIIGSTPNYSITEGEFSISY